MLGRPVGRLRGGRRVVQIRELSRRLKRQHPALIAASWWGRSLTNQWVHRRPHEPSFKILRQLELGEGPMLDIGANMGQSVLSMRLFAPNEIISFEIDPRLRTQLRAISVMARRHRVHITGLGSTESAADLHTPVFGRFRVTSRSSLDPDFLESERALLEEKYGRRMGIAVTPVTIKRLSSFDLRPSFVKIDVEGAELDVLEGAERTLLGSFPPVLYEQRGGTGGARKHLESLGYSTFEVHGERLVECSEATTALNLLALRSP